MAKQKIIKRSYGWRRDLPDYRDFHFDHVGMLPLAASMESADLRAADPPIYDQGPYGSCTANGGSEVMRHAMNVSGQPDAIVPSRMFIWWQTRAGEGTADQDAGCTIRDTIKAMVRLGAPDESAWAYTDRHVTAKPPGKVVKLARLHKVTGYQRVDQSQPAVEAAVAAGVPVIFGMTVFDSFESDAVAQTGMVPMPGADEGTLGGHCMVIVGYDRASRLFTVRNSWGDGWGEAGYCHIPYDYLLDPGLAADFWAVTSVA